MYYLNNSHATRVFQGVTFKPGEVAEVPTWINDPTMIRVKAPAKPEPVKPAKATTKGTSSAAKSAAKTTKQTAAKTAVDTPKIESKEENTDGKHSDK